MCTSVAIRVITLDWTTSKVVVAEALHLVLAFFFSSSDSLHFLLLPFGMIDHARTIAALHRNAFTFCFGSSFFVFFFRVRRLSSIVTDLLYWTGCNASLTAPAAFVFRFSLQHRLSREKKKYQSPTRLIPIDRFDSIQTPERMNRCFFLLFLLFVYIKF